MNIKRAAVNALQFVRKFGMGCAGSGTRGLVRLADGTVEEQTISYSRRGKVVTSRRVVGKDEMAKFQVVAYLEDHLAAQPVKGRTEFVVYLDDAQFRLERGERLRQRQAEFLLGYKGVTWLEEGIVDPAIKPPAHLL